MQGTLFRHREKDIFLSVHINVLLLVADKQNTDEIFEKLSKKLSLKIDGPYGADAMDPTLWLHPEQGQGQEKPRFYSWNSNAGSNAESSG